MSKQMAIPFSIGQDGGVDVVTDPVQSLADRVRALTATLPSQRVMRSTFGVATTGVMFAWDANVGQMQLQQMVTEAVALWEPSARVLSITPVMTPDGAEIIGVDVDISSGDPVAATGSSQYSVLISASGEVTRTG